MKLEPLVEAAVYVGRADGQFSEAELEVFIDELRAIVGEPVSASELISRARKARADLRVMGRPAFLAKLRVKLADVPETAVQALVTAIARVGGLTPEERQALDELSVTSR